MHPEPPLVSAIIPTYQAAGMLGRALDSALGQDYPALEVVVADDGSTDETRQVVEHYQACDSRVHYLWQPNQGPGAARNLAVAHSNGDYLAFLDADDEWRPGKFQLQVDILTRHASVGLTFTEGLDIDSRKGRTTRRTQGHASALRAVRLEPLALFENVFVAHGNLPRTLILDCFIGISTVMLRRRVFEQIGGFKLSLAGTEDVDLWIRAARVCEFAFCSGELTVNHFSPASMGRLSAAWIGALIAYYQGCLTSPDYADLRTEARRGLRQAYRQLVFYYGRQRRPLQAMATFRASLKAGFDWLGAACALGSWLGPWPFMAAGRLIWP